MLTETQFILHSKEKEDPKAPNINKRRNRRLNSEATAMTSHSETLND